MADALRTLSGSGAMGAILAVSFALLAATVGVLAWALKRLVEAALRQQEHFVEFMDALTKSLNAIGINCLSCRQDSVASLRDMERSMATKIDQTVWAAHDKAVLITDATVERAVDRIEESFTGAANAIRESNVRLVQDIENRRLQERLDDLSRPHDVGGVVR